MSDSQTTPISEQEQNSSSSEDFEFIEKEENGAFGVTTKETTLHGVSDEILDLNPPLTLDSDQTEVIKDSEINNLVDLETSNLGGNTNTKESPMNQMETDSLVIIDRNAPEIIPSEQTGDILPEIEPEIPFRVANTETGMSDKDVIEIREIFSQNLLDSPTTIDSVEKNDEQRHQEQLHPEQRQDEQRHDEQLYDEQRHDEQRHDEQRHDEQLYDEQRHDGQRHDEQRHDEQRHDEQLHEQRHHEQRQDESEVYVPYKQLEEVRESQDVVTEPEANQSIETDKLIEYETSNSPNIIIGDNPVVQDDTITIFYTDRDNSPEPPSDTSSVYSYPVEHEFWEIEDVDDAQASNARWKHVYMQLHMQSVENPPSQRIAKMQQNRPLNRYSNILANDSTRIILTHPETEYINANFISVPEVNRTYIMTQGPLDITSEHFWHMIWQENCPGIVMLNRTFESGKIKCYQYFPKDPGQQLVFGNYLIVCQSQYDADCYRMSNLELTHLPSQELRRIIHFQYLSWPDFGAPQTPEDFLQFLAAVRDKGILSIEVNGPPVVHCSAGVGRSGTFILVDACLRTIEMEGHPLNVHVQDLILRMRQQRFGCIQSDEQLRFSYVAILVATHNIMSDMPIAIVPELVERVRQEILTASPIPPKRTTSRIIKFKTEIIQPSDEFIAESPPCEISATTKLDNEPQEFIRERIRTEINPKIIPPIHDTTIENESRFSKLNITLAVIVLSVGVSLFYLLFF